VAIQNKKVARAGGDPLQAKREASAVLTFEEAAREVVKEGDVFTNRIIGVALENHSDAYAENCKM
jgi:hypothetical protein